MSISVRIPDEEYKKVKSFALKGHRSISSQVKLMLNAGMAALDNPDLSYDSIVGILEAQEEIARNGAIPYKPGDPF